MLLSPFRAAFRCFVDPRAALSDVWSLSSALGYVVAAPFGAYSEMDRDSKELGVRLAPTDGILVTHCNGMDPLDIVSRQAMLPSTGKD